MREPVLVPNSELPPKERVVYDPKVSNVTQSLLDNQEQVRNLNFFNRVFRGIDTGSMRGVVLMWIRMTLGIGILTLPYFVKVFGANLGLLIIIFSAILNYLTYTYIFEASYYTGKQNFFELIETLLGKRILWVFRITYMCDVCSTIMIYAIVSWNLFEYCLWFVGITH